jgi:AcrR family transcriptional regulator
MFRSVRPMSEGLRERKKVATRAALIEAAWRLSAEHGVARVRVEDIAAAAGVSARTFNNYFASKEDALVAVGTDRAERIAAAVRARPPDEPLWEALGNAFAEQFVGAGEDTRHFALADSTPELVAAQLRMHRTVDEPIVAAVADRIGVPATELYPKLVAAVVRAAVRTRVEHSPDAALPDQLRELIVRLGAGLPEVPRG